MYVAPLGPSIDAERIRDAIRLRLGESRRFIVVDQPSADAILSGVAGVEQAVRRLLTDAANDYVARSHPPTTHFPAVASERAHICIGHIIPISQ